VGGNRATAALGMFNVYFTKCNNRAGKRKCKRKLLPSQDHDKQNSIWLAEKKKIQNLTQPIN